MRKKNKKHKIVAFLFTIILIGIGYAYLTANLKITGTTKIGNARFDVHFENAQKRYATSNVTFSSNSNSNIEPGTPIIKGENNTELEWEVTLNRPGDRYDFSVDVVNSGDIFAYVDYNNTFLTYQIGDEEAVTISLSDFYEDSSILEPLNFDIFLSRIYIRPGEIQELGGYVTLKEDITNEQWESIRGKTIKLNVNYCFIQGEESEFIHPGSMDVRFDNPIVNSIGTTTTFPSNINSNIPIITNKSYSFALTDFTDHTLEYEVIFNSIDDYYDFSVDIINNENYSIGIDELRISVQIDGGEIITHRTLDEIIRNEYFKWTFDDSYDNSFITISKNHTVHTNLVFSLKDNLTEEQLNNVLGKVIKVKYFFEYSKYNQYTHDQM